jgi:histidinol phosphatase-like PHP family hydrolase
MTSKKFNNAVQEINGLSRDVEPIKLEKGAEIEIIGKFTEKVALERGGAAQILDRGRGG